MESAIVRIKTQIIYDRKFVLELVVFVDVELLLVYYIFYGRTLPSTLVYQLAEVHIGKQHYEIELNNFATQ